MLFNITDLIVLFLALAFWIMIAWAVVMMVKALQRIADNLEMIVRQNEERLKS